MAEILLFHHVCGLTDGVAALGDDLRAAGHVVHVPDLFGGRTFDTVEEGVAHLEDAGLDRVVAKGLDAADGLPEAIVYAGISLGVVPAQQLAQTRPGACGAVLLEACVPADVWGGWPSGVPVQVHGMEADPFFAGEGDIDAARALVDGAAPSARAELHTYAGDRHLFTDRSLPSHDPSAAATALERVLGFLDAITPAGRA